ncbi:uncharacterized protein LOC120340999 [Styela clava]
MKDKDISLLKKKKRKNPVESGDKDRRNNDNTEHLEIASEKSKKHKKKVKLPSENEQLSEVPNKNSMETVKESNINLDSKVDVKNAASTNKKSGKKRKANKKNDDDKTKKNGKRMKFSDKKEIWADKKAKKALESLLTEDLDQPGDVETIDKADEQEETTLPKKAKKRGKINKENSEEKEVDPVDTLKSQKKEEALSNLLEWKNDRENWKFRKVRQIWLVKHMYDQDAINDTNFNYLVEYLEGSKGGARSRLITDAQSIYDSLTEDDDNDSTVKLKRARHILQAIAE